MASLALFCDVCGTVLSVTSDLKTPLDIESARLGYAEQELNLSIACSSDTCPSQVRIRDSNAIMEGAQAEQPPGQLGDVESIDSQMLRGGQQPQLPDSQYPPPEQQSELSQLKLPLQQELGRVGQQEQNQEAGEDGSHLLPDFPQSIDGKPVHQGINPCRLCYRDGRNCLRDPGSVFCNRCQNANVACIKSLAGLEPKGVWTRTVVLDYASPCSVDASRTREGPDGEDIIQYHVKFAWRRGKPVWKAAETLKEYPWVLKKFHHDNPHMPGPEGWLVEEEGDDFFYGTESTHPGTQAS